MFRHLISVLSGTRRVVVPDHMGFGKSETPPGRSYWLQDHIDNLERLVLALDLRDISLVMHDFGGPVGMGLAARHPSRIRRVISTNGPTPFGQADLVDRVTANARVSPWFQWIGKAAADGSLEPVLGQLGFNILSTLKLNGFENSAIITDTWLAAYGAPFVSPADCLGAIGWAKASPRVRTDSRHPVRPLSTRSAQSLRWRSGARQIARYARDTSSRSSAASSPTHLSSVSGVPGIIASRMPPRRSRRWS